MISGTMPRRDRIAAWIMCGLMYLFCGIALYGSGLCLAAPAKVRHPPPAPLSMTYMALSVAGIALQTRFWRRNIRHIEYSGGELRFRTFGVAKMQARPLRDLAKVDPWVAGREHSVRGYRLQFRDGGKVYLDFAVSNCAELIGQIRAGLGAVPSSLFPG